MTTRTILYPLLIAGLLGAYAAITGAAPAEDADRSLVRVHVTYQEHDVYMPWQKREPGKRRGYGVVVGPGEVITTESLVRNHTLVELQYARSGTKHSATVVLADEQVDLALLRYDAPADTDATPLVPAASIDRGADLTILQLDASLELQRGSGKVLRVAMGMLASAPYSVPLETVLTDINVNGNGAPVVQDGALAGIVLGYNHSKRTASVLTAGMLRHFLDDAREEPYGGFARAGFIWRTLVDPAKRAFLGLEDGAEGILILTCLPGSGAAQSLQPNDVILEWDGHSLDSLGYYEDPELGRMQMSYLAMGKREPGDRVSAVVLREKQRENVTVLLSHRTEAQSLIPENVPRHQPAYLVEGGLILRELTGRFMKQRGKSWVGNVDSRLAHLYLTRQHLPEEPGDRVVILAGVLPDRINIDYARFRGEIVTSVNGLPVRNMLDVFGAVGMDGAVERIGLQSVGIELVLDQAALAAANRRIARQYRVPRLRHGMPVPEN